MWRARAATPCSRAAPDLQTVTGLWSTGAVGGFPSAEMKLVLLLCGEAKSLGTSWKVLVVLHWAASHVFIGAGRPSPQFGATPRANPRPAKRSAPRMEPLAPGPSREHHQSHHMGEMALTGAADTALFLVDAARDLQPEEALKLFAGLRFAPAGGSWPSTLGRVRLRSLDARSAGHRRRRRRRAKHSSLSC